MSRHINRHYNIFVKYLSFKKFLASTFWQSLNTLPPRDKTKFIIVTLLQIGLGFIDLLGIAVIGVLGSLAVSGISSRRPGNRVSSFLDLLGLSNSPFQIAILAAIAVFILVFRTFASILVLKRIYLFLSNRSALMTSSLVKKLLSQSLLDVQRRSTQEHTYALTYGVSAITLGVLGSTVSIVSDGSLLIIITMGLFLVDPTIAFSSIVLFGLMGIVLYRSMNLKAQKLGIKSAELSIKSNKKIMEVLESYRESVVRNRRSYYASQISKIRFDFASTQADLQFMPNMSKYIIESGVVIGAVLISGIQFLLNDSAHAIATLSVFLASGTRIAPAIMRIQQSAMLIKSSEGSALSTIQLLKELSQVKSRDSENTFLDTRHEGFLGKIEFKDVWLNFPPSQKYALAGINLNITTGESIALVGPSGAGKTSLVDVMLGVITPTRGHVKISGEFPSDCVSIWPGAIGYVPQDVKILEGTFYENITLGYDDIEIDQQLLLDALEVSQLLEFVQSLPNGLNTIVGERGTTLSGGQRQRLGIARAMFTKPKLLVLDEATSALDGQTEAEISKSIELLRGKVTVIMIAHRLSTIRHADKVVYLEDGQIIAQGPFEVVRAKVPDFDEQAQLMGL